MLSADNSTPSGGPETTIAPSDLPFTISFQNLKPLDKGIYELWLIRSDVSYSWGKFQPNIAGNNFAAGTEFNKIAVDPQAGDSIVVTIEAEQDGSPRASGITVLTGRLAATEDDKANLRHPIDVTATAGEYILATPTNDPEAFETSGIWFTQPDGSAVSLSLPELVEGWIYEAWVSHRGHTLSAGRFKHAGMADDFAGYSGEKPGPNYPGEDFVDNLPADFSQPLDLVDGASRVFISLEPDLGGADPTDANPVGSGSQSLLPFLEAVISAGAVDHKLYPLELVTAALPSAIVELR